MNELDRLLDLAQGISTPLLIVLIAFAWNIEKKIQKVLLRIVKIETTLEIEVKPDVKI